MTIWFAMAPENTNASPAPQGNWLFAGADQLYAAYVKHYGQTFDAQWLAYPEWQILLTCVAGAGNHDSVVNQNSLPVLTNRSISAYMEAVWKVKGTRPVK